jgi:histidinol-phosphate aminotransferase
MSAAARLLTTAALPASPVPADAAPAGALPEGQGGLGFDADVVHGGPDGGPAIRWDFSTNANPIPAPANVLTHLAQADRSRYPDPSYDALRTTLGRAWAVEPERVLPTAGSSEAIRRLSLAAQLQGVRSVWVPSPGYGDYLAAAQALGLAVHGYVDGDTLLAGLQAYRQTGAQGPVLVWLNEPCNPTGASLPPAFWQALHSLIADGVCTVALDRAYEPLRLTGSDPIAAHTAALCWQLWSPNKAMGFTGVRAGAMLAPDVSRVAEPVRQAQWALLRRVQALAPSWVLSAEGVALLQAWQAPETQRWLSQARITLTSWMATQRTMLSELGFEHLPSVTHFGLSRPLGLTPDQMAQALAHLRHGGIKLRDTTSMGLPGWWRLGTQSPLAQAALRDAWLNRSQSACSQRGRTT